MKYKHKEIEKIKAEYGVEGLHFYNGSIMVHSPDIPDYYPLITPATICSIKSPHKRVYKNNTDIHAASRLTATQLADFLGILKAQQDMRYSSRLQCILFEQTNKKYTRLDNLRVDYLIAKLSGLLY